ncbi:hypothetical protein F3Y22_tig00111503pilonHSYRG00053 [Hibiscus syriacus]|uniref:Uncharacterized protein n=1 Tax=Hibiscus syriacus TaxID=106335 RepID=A0A6A2XPN0_HIBSY|nr:hypothetical protein F3Y22_tig00111503pilonHSYRG00053 [Hibiscus syriacus]
MNQIFLGLCHKLYNFITKYLATCAMKRVTLGQGSHQDSTHLPSPGSGSAISSSITDQAMLPVADQTPVEDASLQAKLEPGPICNHSESGISSATSNGEKNEDEAPATSSIRPEVRPPRKMVSINDIVEEMTATASKKKKSKKKRTEKMGSFDQEIIEEPKPLKSILKVGSKIDESNSLESS